MSYNVYRVEYLGEPNHVGLFVETKSDGDGVIYHVIGNALKDMAYERKNALRPESLRTIVRGTKQLVGTVSQSNMDQLDAACRAIPPPAKQTSSQGQLLDPDNPLRRCGEWVEEVTDSIKSQGILVS